MTASATIKKQRQPKPPTQVLTVRITQQQQQAFEIKCLENRIPMSRILQQAVEGYLKN